MDQRLQELSVEQIRATLLARARGLPSDRRTPFLDIFSATPPRELEDQPVDTTWPVSEDPLRNDVDAFVGRVAAGKYFLGFGWDD